MLSLLEGLIQRLFDAVIIFYLLLADIFNVVTKFIKWWLYKLQQPHTKQPLFNYSFATSEEAEVAFIPLPLIEYLYICIFCVWLFSTSFVSDSLWIH